MRMRKFLLSLLLPAIAFAQPGPPPTDPIEALLTDIEANQLPDGHNVTVGNATIAVTQSGSWTNACTQSGTWNITNISGTVSLPTGAATSANQSTMIGHVDGIEGLIGTTNTNTSNINNKFVAAAALADAQANPTTTRTGSPIQIFNGTTWDRARGDTTNGLDVDVTRSVLPTGAATSANQSTGNSTLSSILTELGQKTEPADTQTVSGTVEVTNEAVSSVTEATCGVTTSSASCLASSGSRKGGYLQNVSDTDVWCSLGGTATAAAPTTLIKVNGVLDFTTGGVVYTGAINCIHAGSGTKNVTVVSF